MEECGHVLKQFIQSGLMNYEECKTECPHNLWTLKYQVLAGFGHYSLTKRRVTMDA
jgi:hypothetical protein